MKSVWLLASLVVLAGCLDSDTVDKDPVEDNPYGEAVRLTIPEDPMPDGPDHDHTDPAAHKFLWNYEFSARDPLLQNQANIAGVHALDQAAGYLFGAVYGSHTVAVDGGLAIWSLEDPANPQLTGRFTVPGAVGGDRSLEVTADGNYAVLGTEPVTCLGQVNPTAVSVYLIDTTNKALPTVADVITVGGANRANIDTPTGSISEHSITVHNINGTEYAFVFGKIYEIDVGEQGAQFVQTGAQINVGHDMYVRDTPWGDVWALAANGGGGVQVYNVTDPFNPVEIGSWDLPDRDARSEEYYFHTADVAFFDEQIVVVISSEDWLDHPSPFWILDASMLKGAQSSQLMEWIGTWINPGKHTAIGTSFSLHNPRFTHDGVFTISSYHGGLWQMDFRHPDFRAQPAEVAYAVYSEDDPPLMQDPVHQAVESNLCGLGLTLDTPTYMDVEVHESGILYAADVYMGLYTFTPTADHPLFGEGGRLAGLPTE